MPVKTDDSKTRTRTVLLTRSCVVNGAPQKKNAKVTVSIADGNFLVACHKAVAAEPDKAPEAPKK